MSVSTDTYPAMLRKPPVGAMLPLLLIFVFGIAVGALAMSFIHHAGTSPPPYSWTPATALRWKKELNLSEKQQHELQTTLDDFSKYYSNVLADGKDRILAILDDSQRAKFERMLREKRKP